MKKLLSVIISVIAVVAVCASFAIPSMAAINVYSPEGEVIVHRLNEPTVNGEKSTKIGAAQSSTDSDTFTFTFSGTEKLLGWNLIDKNGKKIALSDSDASYKIVAKEGKILTIKILDWTYFEAPDGYTVNALVEADSTGGTADKDDSSKAPETGAVSIALASVAAAGAGAAVLALSKKKDAE